MIKNAWEKLPAWLRGAVGLVLSFLVLVTVLALIDGVGREDPAWGFALSISLLVLVFVGLYVMYRVGRNRVGGRAQHKMFRQAVRSGELPPDADVERWRPWLEKAAGDSSGEWLYAFLALLVFGVNVSAVGRVDDPGPGIILAAVGIAVLVAAVFPGASSTGIDATQGASSTRCRHARRVMCDGSARSPVGMGWICHAAGRGLRSRDQRCATDAAAPTHVTATTT